MHVQKRIRVALVGFLIVQKPIGVPLVRSDGSAKADNKACYPVLHSCKGGQQGFLSGFRQCKGGQQGFLSGFRHAIPARASAVPDEIGATAIAYWHAPL